MWLFLLGVAVLAYPCRFTASDGTVYDLSKFERDIPDYEADAMDYVYRVNICGDTAKLCNGESGIGTQWFYNGNCVSVIARQGPTPPTLTKALDGTITLSYTNGDNCHNGPRKVNYIFHCSKGDTKIGLAEESTVCLYEFDVYSKDACFSKPAVVKSKTRYFYYILGIIFMYFVLGWGYNKYQDKELGMIEAIPHSERALDCITNLLDKARGSSK